MPPTTSVWRRRRAGGVSYLVYYQRPGQPDMVYEVDSESQPVVVLGRGYVLINGRRGEEFPHWTEEIVPLEDPREVASFGGAVEEQLHPAPGGALEQQPQPAPVCDAAVPAHSLAKVVLVGVAALVLLRGRMRVTCS